MLIGKFFGFRFAPPPLSRAGILTLFKELFTFVSFLRRLFQHQQKNNKSFYDNYMKIGIINIVVSIGLGLG